MTAQAMTLPRAPEISFSLPWLPLLPLLAIPFMGTDPIAIDNVIVAIEVIFLVMAIRNPVWVLGALMLSELTVRNYYIDLNGISMTTRLFITLSATVIVLPQFARTDLGPRSKPMLGLALLFIGITTLGNAISSDGDYVAQFSRFALTGFLALVLVPVAISSRDDVVKIGTAVFVIAMASTLVALMQHYHFRGAPVIATVPNDIFDTGFEAWQGRSLGLAENPVYLTNDLLFVLLPIVGVLMTAAVPERHRGFVAVCAVMILGALYFTQTRSWVLGAVPGMAAMAFLLSPRMRRDALVFVLLFGVLFWAWSSHAGNRYAATDDDSASARPVLWSASFDIVKDHPLIGVGHDKFLELSPQYAGEDQVVEEPLIENVLDPNDVLGRFAPHNDYLNVWLSWGTFALAAYLAILVATLINLKDAFYQLRDPFLKGIALGGLGALIAFCSNSFFHNFFDSTLTIWILAGLSLAMIKLAALERQAEMEAAWSA